MRSVLGSCLLSLVLAAPAPQDLELVVDYPDYPDVEEPTLVLVRPSFGGFGDFSRIPGFGSFPSTFGDFPSTLPASFGFEESSPKISISLSDIFGAQPAGEQGRVPGIITSLFDVLGDHLGVEGGEGGDRTVTVQGDGEYDHHNNTYEEKVLPDGSVVRVNRTTIQDTDQDGNTFFFSTSVHHVLDGEDSVEGSAEEGEDTGPDTFPDVEEAEEDQDAETVGEVFRDYEQDAEFVPTDIDETENEVDFDKIRERKAKAEFPGVDDTASVEGLFE